MSGSPAGVEIEIKIPVKELGAVRARLTATGARESAPRHHELNTLYDDERRSLRGRGCTIRVREACGRTIVTFKGKARFEDRIKIRPEFETTVESAEIFRKILEGLGLAPAFRYEKFREEYCLDTCRVMLDETPVGSFVEVEGDQDTLGPVLAKLALDAATAVTDSYAGLYRKARERDDELPRDMLFRR